MSKKAAMLDGRQARIRVGSTCGVAAPRLAPKCLSYYVVDIPWIQPHFSLPQRLGWQMTA
jgi:hypothetical protein